MSLTVHQRSVYLIIFNATMISRSVGKSIKGKRDIKDFKVCVFKKLESLTGLMDNNELTEGDILQAIEKISNEFQISWGQAQKPINVILKYHFYLTRKDDNRTKKILHCPLDSVIMQKINKEGIWLTNIQKTQYLEIQKDIGKLCFPRIEFDDQWDKQHLQAEGLAKVCGCTEEMEEIMRLMGKSTWTEYQGESNPKEVVCGSGKVTEASITPEEINFTFMQGSKEYYATLKNDGGFHYKGEYTLKRMPRGRATFMLYENQEGYFLYGDYDGHQGTDEGHGRWWVELKKSPIPSKGEIKNGAR